MFLEPIGPATEKLMLLNDEKLHAARRWARAWKKVAKHGDDAGDYFIGELDKQHKCIASLEDTLRHAVANFNCACVRTGQKDCIHKRIERVARALLLEDKS